MFRFSTKRAWAAGALVLSGACANPGPLGGPQNSEPVTDVIVQPSDATIPVSGTVQLWAEQRTASGETASGSPTWTSLDQSVATVASNGVVSGAAAGEARIVAARNEASDTARVTVVVQPQVDATCGNEPSGMTVATNTPWDAPPPPLPQHDDYGWGYEYSGNNISVVSDPTAPKSPDNVLRTTYPAGFRGGSAPANIEVDLEGSPTTVYVCYWVKRSANWTDNGNAGTKFFFVFTPYAGQPDYSHAYVAMNRNLTHHFALESGGGVPGIDYYGPQDDVGTWRKYEYLFVANSPGQANGSFTAWKNGVPFMSRTGIRYFPADRTPAFNRVQWSPTYGGGNNPVPYTLTQDIDHWYISVK